MPLNEPGGKGEPSLGANVYAGWLYLHGTEYRDEAEDPAGKVVQLLRARTTGIVPQTRRFKPPELVSGDSEIYAAQFAAGWSSSDFHGDTATSNCSEQ
ncbi:hypothetical protein [Sorangium sp. So ce1000]|uniref:hypothetical protein n=1 Tax=Sorangium sp. So ce1000 TaxID=3133325 RepID=UPI003F648E2E